MITAFKLWENFIGEANTHQGGHIKPNRNFINWCNTISIDIYNDLVKEFEKTRVISDMLTPFLRIKNITVSAVPNQMWDVVALPSDYNYFASARNIRKNGISCGCSKYDTIDGKNGVEITECTSYIDEDEMERLQIEKDKNLVEVSIEKIRTAQWTSVCQHVTMGPTVNEPKCTQYEGGLQLAPKGFSVIILTYFRKPIEAEFLYTILNPGAENEYIQYNINSKKFEWDDKMIPEFLTRLKEKYGTFVREQSLVGSGIQGKKI